MSTDLIQELADMKRQIEELQRNSGVVDTGWTAVTLLNSWVNYDTTYGVTNKTYIRKIGKVVYIRGLIKDGTLNTAAFTLPVGWRPAINIILASVSIDVFHSLRINSDGNFYPYGGGSNAWCSISCSFPIS